MKAMLMPQESGRGRLNQGELAVGVVGGGIAGLAAACVLSEHGARVTLYEGETFFGGRAGSWPESLAGVGNFEMERGFHAFFRQYYNLRSLLRRVDPNLEMLAPLDDYPLLASTGSVSFAGLSRRFPINLVQLLCRVEGVGLRDLARMDVRSALDMLRFSLEETYADLDDVSAKEYLDGLRFPAVPRRLLFDVFAHSFFNPEAELSAAELIMMFHFYFVGNPEGLVFDVARRPFSAAMFQPLATHLASRGVALASGDAVVGVAQRKPGGFSIATSRGRLDDVDACVLALPVAELKRLMASSTGLDAHPSPGARAPGVGQLRDGVDSLAVTRPFAVWRLWLDRPTREGRSPFVATTGDLLDSITLYHLLEDESRAWATGAGGAVVELHAYALPLDVDEVDVKRRLLAGLNEYYAETRGAAVIAERFLLRRDCVAFAPGSWKRRPGVATSVPGLVLAGDFVKLPVPTALMERAATSGMMAANHLLRARGVAGEPIWSVPVRGVLGPRPRRQTS